MNKEVLELVLYSVYLECHEDDGTPYPLLASFNTEEQAEQYIEAMEEPHKFYAFIEKETYTGGVR